MLYFSEINGRKVVDKQGRLLGKVYDIGVDLREKLPSSNELVVLKTKRGKRSFITIPWQYVSSISEKDRVTLNITVEEAQGMAGVGADFKLGKNLLDSQIVDLHGRRVLRVNDLILAEFDTTLVLTGVDISALGILRRLGLKKTLEPVLRFFGVGLEEKTISWNYVATVDIQPEGVKLRIARDQLKTLRPSDIADILEQLDPEMRMRTLDILDIYTAAESLSEVEAEQQMDILGDLGEVRASEILENMPPDEATDILGLLPRDKVERLLNIMSSEKASTIRELLGYEEHTAGGRMTTEFISVPTSWTAGECIDYLREKAPSAETIYYTYVLDDENRLKGVLSLRDLLLADPSTPLEQIMSYDVISVNVADDQETVADAMNKYNFLALPVVDDNNILKGIITVDDMIDVLVEESREDISQIRGLPYESAGWISALISRLPVIALALISGLLASLIIYLFKARIIYALALIFFLPLFFRSNQDIVLLGQAILLDSLGGKDLGIKDYIVLGFSELKTVCVIASLLAVCSIPFALWWQESLKFALAVFISILATIMLSTSLSSIMVMAQLRLRTDGIFYRTRLISLAIVVVTLLVYLGIASIFLRK